MKRNADQTGFYKKSEYQPIDEDKANHIVLLLVALIFLVCSILSGCASTTPTIGECIDGRVTWSDGTTSSCKILKESGSI